jgi:hypothetical protein
MWHSQHLYDCLPLLCPRPLHVHSQHLHLDLSEGAELCLSTGDELGPLRRLRRLTLTGECRAAGSGGCYKPLVL